MKSQLHLFKSFLILAVVVCIAVFTVIFSGLASNKNGNQDIRSRAANPAENVVDSDAVFNAQVQSFQSVATDRNLNMDVISSKDDVDIQGINALQISQPLSAAKNIALSQVTDRDKDVAQMVQTLNSRKGFLFDSDFTKANSMISKTQTQLAQWRADINATNTIDGMKKIQTDRIKSTRVYTVLLPKFKMQVISGISTKTTAQIAKRLDNQTIKFQSKPKKPNDARSKDVATKLDKTKQDSRVVNDLNANSKVQIDLLTTDQSNANPSGFNKSIQVIKGKMTDIRTKIIIQISQVKEIQSTIVAL